MQKTLGITIAELRKSQGLTQLELAEKMGVTDKAVSKWERDLSCPDINSLPCLAEALGVSVDELMQMKTETNQPPRASKMIDTVCKRVHFHYIIYLIVMGILLSLGAVTNVQLIPSLRVHIDFSNIINFFDPWGIFCVLAVCLAALICTKSIRSMKNAFVFMFRKSHFTTAQYKDCLLAVRTAVSFAFAGGGMMFLISVVNMLKSMDLHGGSSSLGTKLSLGLLSLIYALVIAFILLPVYVSLRRGLMQNQEMDNVRYAIAQSTNRTSRS